MEIHFTLEEYLHQLKLMQEQYGQEEELYPWVYMMLQMAECEKRKYGIDENLSIRQVAKASGAKDYPGRKLIYGYGAFPDICIFDEKFNARKEWCDNKNKLYGCVEIKKLFEKGNIVNLKPIKEGNHSLRIEKVRYIYDMEFRNEKQSVYPKVYMSLFAPLDLIRLPKNEQTIKYTKFVSADKNKRLINSLPKEHWNGEIRDKVNVKVTGKVQGNIAFGNSILHLELDSGYRELFAELLWYGKVLYTNGLVWKYLKISEINDNKEITSIQKLREKLYPKCVNVEIPNQAWCGAIETLQKLENGLQITISCQEIGNLTKAYNRIKDEKSFQSKDLKLVDKIRWAQLKCNLRRIKWSTECNPHFFSLTKLTYRKRKLKHIMLKKPTNRKDRP